MTTTDFEGHPGRTCGEHRTVGPHRAWCFDCSEWCYPGQPCVRCDLPPTREQVWNVISRVRDAAPRLPNDASTDAIIDALVDAGLLNLQPEVAGSDPREPRVWPVGSPEPHDVDKVRGTNDVTFEAYRFSSGFQRWTAQPPGGGGRDYGWCQMNWDERGGPGRGMELTEILDTEKNSLNEAVQ